MIDTTEFFKDYAPGQATGELPELPELPDIKRELEQCKLDRDRYQSLASSLAEEVERLTIEANDRHLVAWAAFADNGNIRLWTLSADEVEAMSDRIGHPLTPLYRDPTVKDYLTAQKSATEDQPQ